MILYCKRQGCGVGYASTGEVPLVCPSCQQPTRWGSSPPPAGTDVALALSVADKRLLRSLKIDPES